MSSHISTYPRPVARYVLLFVQLYQGIQCEGGNPMSSHISTYPRPVARYVLLFVQLYQGIQCEGGNPMSSHISTNPRPVARSVLLFAQLYQGIQCEGGNNSTANTTCPLKYQGTSSAPNWLVDKFSNCSFTGLLIDCELCTVDGGHRRRIKKRQRSSLLIGGEDFIQFFAMLPILPIWRF